MDTLYQEYLHGRAAYLTAMKARVKRVRNMQPVAPREPKIAYQVYMVAPDYIKSDGDIYDKGALFLHALRLNPQNFVSHGQHIIVFLNNDISYVIRLEF